MPRKMKMDYLTVTLFKEEMGKLYGRMDIQDGRIDKVDGRMDKVDSRLDNMALEIVNLRSDMREMKETMATKTDINSILNRIDDFVKNVNIQDHNSLIHFAWLKRIDPVLDNHETRITALEHR